MFYIFLWENNTFIYNVVQIAQTIHMTINFRFIITINFITIIIIIIIIYIYIYIVIHRQTVSLYQNSSVWLDTQDARSRDRNPANFTLD